MTLVEVILIMSAGVAAGMINAVVGSGSLITFPALLACGFPPLLANVSNGLGLVPGGVASVWGYRRELTDQWRRLLTMGSMAVLGGIAGAVLLLALPPKSFQVIVPILLAVAIVLVAVQPWIQRRLAARKAARVEGTGTGKDPGVRPAAMTAVGLISVYGGYFGGAQGILMVGALGSLMTEPLQRINALKNGLVTTVNMVAAVAFLVMAPSQIDWRIVGLLAVGSSAGALLGAKVGRRLPQPVLRAFIVAVGIVAIVSLLRG